MSGAIFGRLGRAPYYINYFQALAHAFVNSDGEEQYNNRILRLVFGDHHPAASSEIHWAIAGEVLGEFVSLLILLCHKR